MEVDCREVAVETPVFRFLSAGAELAKQAGRELVGEVSAPSDQEMLGGMVVAYRRGLNGVPFFDYARLALSSGRVTLFERLILLLSNDGLSVTHLLGVVTFKI